MYNKIYYNMWNLYNIYIKIDNMHTEFVLKIINNILYAY